MKRRAGGILLVFILLISLNVSCSKSNETQPMENKDKKSEIRIGITFDTFVLERWTRDRDVFVSTVQKMGAEADVQNAGGDVNKQKEQIRRFIEQKVDTIVIVAVDCFALSEEVEEARASGITVISYDRLIQNSVTDLYITVDNEQVGREMGKNIISELPAGGKVVMICGPEADTNSLEVAKGFEDEIAGTNLEIVSKTHVQSWIAENGFRAVNEVFRTVPEFDAIMCGNDGLAGYVIKALSEQQMAGKVAVTGQDADIEACQRIVEGTQSMTVYKPIEELARTTAECAVELAKSEAFDEKIREGMGEKEIETGKKVPYYKLMPVAVTAGNIDEVIIDSGFHLRDEVYLNVGGTE